jgi:hypothetical protein
VQGKNGRGYKVEGVMNSEVGMRNAENKKRLRAQGTKWYKVEGIRFRVEGQRIIFSATDE